MANTLTALRENLEGTIYIYLDTEETCKRFLQAAEQEGFSFGKIKPTQTKGSNIVALKEEKQLSYVGFVGHMAFGNPGAVEGEFHRIDYHKYAAGEEDYFFKG